MIAAEVLTLVLGAGVALAIVSGVLAHRPDPAHPWLLMALGQSFWVLAAACSLWGEGPAEVLAAGLHVVSLLVLGASLVTMLRRRSPDLAGLLDTSIVVIGLGLFWWALLIEPALDAVGSLDWQAVVVAAYPLADILLLGGAVHVVLSTPGRPFTLRLLAVAFGLLLLADTAAMVGLVTTGDRGDSLRGAAYVVWAAAVVHPSLAARAAGEKPPTQLTPARVAAMTVTAIAPLFTLVLAALAGRPLTVWPVVLGAALMFLLVQLRMLLAMRQLEKVDAQRSRLQEEMTFRASHDSLTDLPNRVETLGLIGSALSRPRSGDELVGVLFVDLDGFKGVNDSLGHRAGDEVLRAVARRLKATTRAGDMATRLGGDEFVVLLPQISGPEAAHAMAQRIIDRLSEPVVLANGREAKVGASVGIALAAPGGSATETLLHEADVALYRAKELGRGRAVLFAEELRSEQEARADLEIALAQAIQRGELVLHYQPILDVRTGELRSVEALVRWDRPGVGLVSPGDFLGAAEASDLVCDLDAWVISEALGQLRSWGEVAGNPGFTVSVNVAARHAANPRIVHDVRRALALHDVPAQRLVLEVSETAVLGNVEVARHLVLLRELGVSVSLVDFGVGLRTASRLAGLPIDSVKISRELLDGEGAGGRAVLELMVRAAHSHGLPVIGEGVERSDQLALLREVECESAQGYYLGRPVSPEQLLLKQVTDRPLWVRRAG